VTTPTTGGNYMPSPPDWLMADVAGASVGGILGRGNPNAILSGATTASGYIALPPGAPTLFIP